MKVLKTIFDIHHEKVENLLARAAQQANPAIWLYLNDLRTPMFMLEATARAADGIYGKPFFKKCKKRYKAVEDAIGILDYYAAFAKEFEGNPSSTATVRQYLDRQTLEKTKKLQRLLDKAGWLDGKRLAKIRGKLKGFKWLGEAKELKAIRDFYANEIGAATAFATATGFVFDHLETDVHELRRQLRWLSIYPQAFQGVFQHQATKGKPGSYLEKYLTPAVRNSPFNVMPTTLPLEKPLLLDKNHFLALSWMIASLANIKDNGLRIEVIKEALQNTALLKDEMAYSEAHKLLGKKQPTLEALLKQAQSISKAFFEEGNLGKLLPKTEKA